MCVCVRFRDNGAREHAASELCVWMSLSVCV
jgi:hypothetical protein